MTDKVANPVTAGPARAGLVAIIVGIQAIAAIFFIADAIGDLAAGEMDFHILVEALIAFALLAGVGIGAWMARRLLAAGGRVIANFGAFYYDYTDLQLQQIVGLTSSITNAAAAEVSGVELEAAWAPDEHWTIGLNGALLKATYKDFVNLDSLNPSLGPQDVSGHYLNNAPKRSANLSVAYRTAPADWGQMTARADISYRSAIYFREFNLPLDTQGAYGLTNLALIWDSADERYRVRLFGENVFDQDYVVQMGSADNLGARYITYGTPRRVGAELRVNF
mgnify:CR=1 FL=1